MSSAATTETAENFANYRPRIIGSAPTPSTAAAVVRAFTLAARYSLDHYLRDVCDADDEGYGPDYAAEVPGMREIFAEANAYARTALTGESLAAATEELAAVQTELAEYYDRIANPAPPEIFEGPQTYAQARAPRNFLPETAGASLERAHAAPTLTDYASTARAFVMSLPPREDSDHWTSAAIWAAADPTPLDFMHTHGDADKWATPLGEAARADLLALAAETGEDPAWLLAGNGTERLMKKHRADIANYVRRVNELMPSIAPAVERAFERTLQGEEPGTTNGHDATA